MRTEQRLPRLIAAASLAALLAGSIAGCGAGGAGLEASGTVEATEADLGFTVPGRLEAVAVEEGDTVRAGAELARLDRAETLARRDQAATQAAAARAALRELERGSRPEEIRKARAAAKAAAETMASAERDAQRAQTLLEGAAIGRQEYDAAQTALEVARSRNEEAVETLKLVEAGPRRERIEAARAELASAEAAVRTLEATLANMVIRATITGVVTVRHHVAGEIVSAGAPVITLLDRNDRWVKVYVPETRLGAVRIGQSASITSDTFKNRRYRGEVVYLSSEAEFTPKAVQTREERVKLVYAVKVQIREDPAYELKPGMPADVVLEGPR
jgi:HlyD family secretion protein